MGVHYMMDGLDSPTILPHIYEEEEEDNDDEEEDYIACLSQP